MSYVSPTTGLPFPAQVALANMGDGLKRWAGLKLLEEASPGSGGDGAQQLAAALEGAFADGLAHAEKLAAFYEKYADEVNAMVAAAAADDSAEGTRSRARKQLADLGDDPAAALVASARKFATRDDDGLCSALFNLMLEAYVCCFAGVEASCGTLWGDLYEHHCP